MVSGAGRPCVQDAVPVSQPVSHRCPMPSLRSLRSILAVALFLALPAVSGAIDLSGCWSGTWESCVTPHKGPLWAEFVSCGGNQYEVHFRGRFFKIMPFQYSVTMT